MMKKTKDKRMSVNQNATIRELPLKNRVLLKGHIERLIQCEQKKKELINRMFAFDLIIDIYKKTLKGEVTIRNFLLHSQKHHEHFEKCLDVMKRERQ